MDTTNKIGQEMYDHLISLNLEDKFDPQTSDFNSYEELLDHCIQWSYDNAEVADVPFNIFAEIELYDKLNITE